MVTSAMATPFLRTSSTPHSSHRQSANKVLLGECSQDDRGNERHHGKRACLTVLRALETQERTEDSWQRERGPAGEDQREKELGPAGDEREDHRRHDPWRSERNGDAPKGAPPRAAVDHRRL